MGVAGVSAAAAPLGMPPLPLTVGMPSPWLCGSHCRDPPTAMSQAGLQARAGSPVRTRYEVRCGLRRGFSPAVYRDSSTPFRAPENVCGARCVRQVCGRVLGASSWGLILSSSIVLVHGCASSSWVCIVLFLVTVQFLVHGGVVHAWVGQIVTFFVYRPPSLPLAALLPLTVLFERRCQHLERRCEPRGRV